MINTSVVGRYIDYSTMTIHTVLMLMPEDYFPGAERFITDKGVGVFPGQDASASFITITGNTLVALT